MITEYKGYRIILKSVPQKLGSTQGGDVFVVEHSDGTRMKGQFATLEQAQWAIDDELGQQSAPK